MTIKILFCATYPDQPIGYGNIAHKISNFLASDDNIDFYYFGFSNSSSSRVERYIHPKIKFIDVIEEEQKINSKLIFGTDIIETYMNQIKPDILFIYNDLLVITSLLSRLEEYKKNNNYKTILYIDLVYPYENTNLMEYIKNNTDFIFCFSDFWKNHLITNGFISDKISVFNHGFSTNLKKIDKYEARSHIGLHKNDFIILNTNRNSYRKALDITISSFLKFYKNNNCDNRLKLFLNCYLRTDNGYDIIELIKVECIKLNLDFNFIVNNQILIMQNNTGQVSDEVINLLYCASDIGINTCVGEGFGLCNLEHASLGISQIVSECGGLIDIFKNTPAILIKPKTTLSISNHLDAHNGEMWICDSNDFAEAIDFYYKNQDRLYYDGQYLEYYIKKNFSWELLLDNFKKTFMSIM